MQTEFLKRNTSITIIIGIIFTFSQEINASELNIPNSFSANTPALAFEVNQNFNAIEVAVDDNNARMEALELLVLSMQSSIIDLQDEVQTQQTTINQLTGELNSLQTNSVLALDGFLIHSVINGYSTAEFTGINVQINDSTGSTHGFVNGLGNLTVGYNEPSQNGEFFCSNPLFDNDEDCLANNAIWDSNVRRGSHNIILGTGNSYDDSGSFISGTRNIVNSPNASVFSGSENIANGYHSIAVGGELNNAKGHFSFVGGGRGNVAFGTNATVSGGNSNKANAYISSISGGVANITNGQSSSISGGYANVTTNTGVSSSISGGTENTTNGIYTSVSGGESNIASGSTTSVSGGHNRAASGIYTWRAGNLTEDN